MRIASTSLFLLVMAGSLWAQDQQIGARTKGMGGSYTAFEDDPVSIWLNPAGIATQPDQMSICYQTYLGFPVDQNRGPADTIEFSVNPETILVDPALLPAYLGFVFQIGDAENPMSIGVCFARPYHINYALDEVADPAQTVFEPEANLEQGFQRFRVAFAKDFRFVPAGPMSCRNERRPRCDRRANRDSRLRCRACATPAAHRIRNQPRHRA